ncbi:MAG: hypothetical protein WBF42_03220 [Terracidiphilus sp.]
MLTFIARFQEKYARPGIITSLKDIMYGLIYPAVLGTGLVLGVMRIFKERTIEGRVHDPALYVAISACAFYMLSFTASVETRADRTKIAYRLPTFLVDLLEVFLMFACFYSLGLLQDESNPPADSSLSPAYLWLLLDVTIVQFLWRLLAGVDVLVAWKSRLAVAAMLTFGIIAGFLGAPRFPDLHPWSDLAVAVVMGVFVFWYVWTDARFWQDD